MNPQVDNYLEIGCGRCPLGGTPDCKVHSWSDELERLRTIVLDCGLVEELKWGVPCYTFQGKNVAIVAAFKESCVLSFFKGALLKDEHKILTQPGENTQTALVARFTDLQEIKEKEAVLKAYLFEAIEVEKLGVKIEKSTELVIPEEFQAKLDENAELKTAFESLTPGRQRGYLLHFSQPKQSKTKLSRIEKYIPKILSGKGFHD